MWEAVSETFALVILRTERSGDESPAWMTYVPLNVEPETEERVTLLPLLRRTVMVLPDWRVRPKWATISMDWPEWYEPLVALVEKEVRLGRLEFITLVSTTYPPPM